MFHKLAKFFIGLTIISGIIAIIYYFYKNNTSEETAEHTIPEDIDSFHLDSDLEPMTKRGYVSLNLNSERDEVKEA